MISKVRIQLDCTQHLKIGDIRMENPRWVTFITWCAYASGAVSILGIISLVGFFTMVIGPLGTLNDIAVAIQYTLMVPIAFALHQLLSPQNPRLGSVALVIGVVGMVAVILLQVMLVAGLIPFEVQIGPVVVAFLVVLWWFTVVGRLARSANRQPSSASLHVWAGLYFGYPFWAFALAKQLRLSEA